MRVAYTHLVMQQAVSRAFRDVTGIAEGAKWPKWPQGSSPEPVDGEVAAEPTPLNLSEAEARSIGLPVDFEKKINHTMNDTALTRISEVAMADLIVSHSGILDP